MADQLDLFARRARRAKPKKRRTCMATKCNGRTTSGRIKKGYRLTKRGLVKSKGSRRRKRR